MPAPPGRFRTFTEPSPVTSMAVAGKWLFAATPDGLLRWDLQAFSYAWLGVEDGLPARRIEAMAASPGGALFVATPAGVARGVEGAWTLRPAPPVGKVAVLLAPDEKSLWAGGSEGLARLQGTSWELFIRKVKVTALAEDGARGLWVGTDGHGLLHLVGNGKGGYEALLVGGSEGCRLTSVRSLTAAGFQVYAFGSEGAESRFVFVDGVRCYSYKPSEPLMPVAVFASAPYSRDQVFLVEGQEILDVVKVAPQDMFPKSPRFSLVAFGQVAGAKRVALTPEPVAPPAPVAGLPGAAEDAPKGPSVRKDVPGSGVQGEVKKGVPRRPATNEPRGVPAKKRKKSKKAVQPEAPVTPPPPSQPASAPLAGLAARSVAWPSAGGVALRGAAEASPNAQGPSAVRCKGCVAPAGTVGERSWDRSQGVASPAGTRGCDRPTDGQDGQGLSGGVRGGIGSAVSLPLPGPLPPLSQLTQVPPEAPRLMVQRRRVTLPQGVTSVLVHGDTIYVGTAGLGVALIQGREMTFLRTHELTEKAERITVACASPSECYVATGGTQAWRFDGERFVPAVVDKEEGNRVLAVVEDARRRVVAIHRGPTGNALKLSRLIDSAWVPIGMQEVEVPHGVPELSFAKFSPSGTLWIGLHYRDEEGEDRYYGAAEVDLDEAKVVYHRIFPAGEVQPQGSLPIPNDVTAVLFRPGETWFSTRSGACLVQGTKVTLFSEAQGLESELLRDIEEGPSGEIWVASSRGLGRYSGGRWNFVREGPLGAKVRAIARGAYGRMWLGTNAGLVLVDGTTIETYGVEHGLLEADVIDVVVDSGDRVWALLPKGVTLVER